MKDEGPGSKCTWLLWRRLVGQSKIPFPLSLGREHYKLTMRERITKNIRERKRTFVTFNEEY